MLIRKEIKRMIQITLEVNDASVIPALEKTLKLLKGVKIKAINSLPNRVTVKAIKNGREGKVIHSKNSTEMFLSF